MNLRLYLFIIVFFICLIRLDAQQPAQTIRGVVLDKSSNSAIPFANIVLLNTNPLIGTTSDSEGKFRLDHVLIGRYDLQISFIGYEPSILREVLVTSAKETFLTIYLKEKSLNLNEVTIKPNVNKEQPINQMASVSARMLSVEEASRYAGGFDDPARLASSFAGVASNIGNNGIVIRGNAPKSLQWKIEGVEIPNPNHFADLATFGGGGLTALSSKMLANSDFLSGAFPAEYSNALSGVFDLSMRTGNNEKNENVFQIGITGTEFASEGPFSKDKNSSYLFNYRYSTLGLIAPILPESGGGVRYQDIAFKFNFPTRHAGTFSFWGIGLMDFSGQDAKTDTTLWYYNTDKEDMEVNQYMGATGISHSFFFSNHIYLKTTLAATVYGLDLKTEKLNDEIILLPENKIRNKNWNFIFSTFLNTKFNAGHTNKSGIVITGLMYDMFLEDIKEEGTPPQTLVNEVGTSTLLQAYSNSNISFTDDINMTFGVNTWLFTLNNNFGIEPRIGFKWQFKPTQSIGFAYGLHSRSERLNYYFTKDMATGSLKNKNLDFSGAQHVVISYGINLSENTILKIEPYLQILYNVPVISDSSFSFINLQNDWFFDDQLENSGKGMNYGLDLTIEKFLTKGFYYMITGSVFNSKYTGGDGIQRNTRYNRNFLFNGLIGREWLMGIRNSNVFGVNIRISYQGGDHYSPVNEPLSIASKDVIYDEYNAFSEQLSPALTGHFTISYTINKKNISHELAFKMINATMYEEFQGFQYNYKTNSVDEIREAIFIPNLSYKIEF